MRETVLIITGTIGGLISSALGGWDLTLQVLIIFIVVDYVTGLIVAGVFKKSKKSTSGALDSHTGFKGIMKKCMMLLLVLVGYQLDYVIGSEFVRYAVIIALIANETLSIIENAGLMGVPIPSVLKQAIEILKKKGDGNGNPQNDKPKS